ncbi:MAG TPA: Cd(II)/Pb(II)-responsive transcriptional regulator [Candidatus Competibacteraceae bacterium]|nr:Cd(II)/Pb(II)-responsive transcriptional regulator [Candidatus Competibacteraceae bacterium]
MRIGELARLTGCEVETIRYYEREGLLDKPQRTLAGYRAYRHEHVAQLNFVRHCRSLGMTLAEIRLLQDYRAHPERTCEVVNRLLDTQIERVREQIAALHLLEQQLRALRERCHEGHAARDCGILQGLEQAAEGSECPCHGRKRATGAEEQARG